MELVYKFILIICLIVFIVWGAPYVWRAYTSIRGARPAFGPPAGNIVGEMEKPAQNTTEFPLSLPAGFSISIFAKDVGGPRVLAFDPAGTLLVSIPSRGQVVALPDENHDGTADRTEVILDHLLSFEPRSFAPCFLYCRNRWRECLQL